MKKLVMVAIIALFMSPSYAEVNPQNPEFEGHVYVAPSAYQSLAQNIYSSLGLTNLTEYWFNAHIYFVDSNGKIVRKVSPLLKGFGTWQRSTRDLIPDDFQGSVWIITGQPIASSAFIHQAVANGGLSLLGTVAIKEVDSSLAAPLMERLDEAVLQDY